MVEIPRFVLLSALLIMDGPAFASSAEVAVLDKSGRPLSDAAVELSAAGAGPGSPNRQLPSEAIIDQRHETFLPLVTVVRKGGHVIFPNNGTTLHQASWF